MRKIARRVGLRVNSFWANIEEVKAWDIPCILATIEDREEGKETWTVLLKISGKEATTFRPGEGKTFQEEIRKDWEGKVIIFWRDLAEAAPNLHSGMKGKDVKTLEKQLKKIGYFKGIPPKGVYGRELEQVVTHFQKKHHLRVDGVVGPQTKMVLYHLLDQSFSPTLSSKED